ncbi:MAG: hypothetical protein HKN26_03190 [Acidimicrobiales bacterium]|nr:hypothetical protein [Acidimicrobiales bacterium]
MLISADGETSTLDASEVQGAVANRLAAGTVGADGTVDLVITLPDDLESGTYVIEVRSTKADGSPFVSRVSFNAGGTLSGPNALAFTGAETTNFVQIAALMILLGLGLTFVASRKRRAASSVTTD